MNARIAAALAAVALGVAGCGSSSSSSAPAKTEANPYAGRAGQARYCRAQGWAYDARENVCRVPR